MQSARARLRRQLAAIWDWVRLALMAVLLVATAAAIAGHALPTFGFLSPDHGLVARLARAGLVAIVSAFQIALGDMASLLASGGGSARFFVALVLWAATGTSFVLTGLLMLAVFV